MNKPEIMYVPDTQIKAGVPLEHIAAAGNYAYLRRPDVIVLAGDWWDMPSLSLWDGAARKVRSASPVKRMSA